MWTSISKVEGMPDLGTQGLDARSPSFVLEEGLFSFRTHTEFPISITWVTHVTLATTDALRKMSALQSFTVAGNT